MRLLGRALFAALLAGVLLWHSSALWQPLSQYWRRLTGPRTEQIVAARSRLTYRLNDDTWTLFAIPAGATRLKVSSNANLPTVLAEDPEVAWHYAVAYELFGREWPSASATRLSPPQPRDSVYRPGYE